MIRFLTIHFLVGVILFLCESSLIYVYHLIFLFFYLYKEYSEKKIESVHIMFTYGINLIFSTVGSIICILNADKGSPYVIYGDFKYANTAGLITFMGNIFLLLGFHCCKSNIPNLSKKLKPTFNFSILFYISLVILVIRQTIDISFLLKGALGTIFDLFPLFNILFLIRLSFVKGLASLRKYAIALVIIQSIYGLLFSYLRMMIVLPIVIYLLGSFSVDIRWQFLFKRQTLLIIGFFLVFNSFFSTLDQVRNERIYGVERIQRFTVIKSEGNIYRGSEDQYNAMIRFSNINQLTSIVSLVQSRGLYNGKTLELLSISLIPRFLWPGKPPIAMGVWFALELGLANKTESWYSNSINMTIPGELYLNFGLFGIIIGCFFVGFILRLFWDASKIWNSPFNFAGTIWGGFLLYQGLFGIGADLQIVVTMLSFYLLFYAFYLVKKYTS